MGDRLLVNGAVTRSGCKRVASWAAVACSVLVVCGPAYAGDCLSGNVAQRMACLKMENAILDEQLKQAVLRKEIARQSHSDVSSRKLSLPLVMATYGVGDKMTAVLVWMRKNKAIGQLTAHMGSRVPGGWVVNRIKNGTVVLQKGSEIKTLLLSSGDASNQSISIPGSHAGFNLSVPNENRPVQGFTGGPAVFPGMTGGH